MACKTVFELFIFGKQSRIHYICRAADAFIESVFNTLSGYIINHIKPWPSKPLNPRSVYGIQNLLSTSDQGVCVCVCACVRACDQLKNTVRGSQEINKRKQRTDLK